MINYRIHTLCMHLAACGCLLFFIGSPAAFAQEDPGPINTERPSYSSSPLALAKGFWQIEAGYQYTHDDDGVTLKEHTLPNALLRYGFLQKFELQISGAGYTSQEVGEVETDGFQDMGIGVKWQINSSEAVLPVALFGGISLPVGSSEFTSDDVDPSLALFWSYSGLLDLFGTAKLAYAGDTYSFDNALGVNVSVSDNIGAFLEYLGNVTEGDGPRHNLNSGITWLLSDNLQVDINAGVGLNTRANDYYTGVGIAYRF